MRPELADPGLLRGYARRLHLACLAHRLSEVPNVVCAGTANGIMLATAFGGECLEHGPPVLVTFHVLPMQTLTENTPPTPLLPNQRVLVVESHLTREVCERFTWIARTVSFELVAFACLGHDGSVVDGAFTGNAMCVPVVCLDDH